jgi:hypothetical protein
MILINAQPGKVLFRGGQSMPLVQHEWALPLSKKQAVPAAQ